MDNLNDEYRKKLKSDGSDNVGGSSTDDYYQLAKEQEYSTLFDKEVSLENAKANALKYTQNQINAQGFGGTGYGSSLQSGIYNTYLNKVGNAQSEYANNIKEINQQEKEAIETQNALTTGNVSAMIQSAGSQQRMDELLADYGYGTIDEKTGAFTWGQKPENMSDDEWNALKYYYRAQQDAFNEATTMSGLIYGSLEDFKGGTYIKKDGSTGSIKSDFRYESEYLWASAQQGAYEKGSAFQVTDEAGQTIYLLFTGNGFKQITSDNYNSTTNKYTVKGSTKDKSKVTINKVNNG